MPAVDEVDGRIATPSIRPLEEVWKGFTHFADDDVLFAKITPCMENGKAAVARGLKNGRGCGSTEFYALRSKGALEPHYLWRFLRQQSFRDDAEQAMTGAVGQRRVPADYLRKTSIPTPPLSEQRRIVEKLDSVTGCTARAREELGRIPKLIQKYRAAILAAAFSGELTKEWRRSNRLRAPTMTNLGAQLSDISYGTAKKCHSNGKGVPVLRIPNVSAGKVDLSDLKYAPFEQKELAKLRLQDGDILIVRSNGSVDLVGKPALIEKSAIGLAYAGYLIRLRPRKEAALPRFLCAMLQSPQIRKIIETNARSTSGVHNINSKELAALEIPRPTIQEQQEIVHRVETAFAWLDRVAGKHADAARLLPKLDQAILTKAFRGELVPQDPNDEPVKLSATPVSTPADGRKRVKRA
jgi:type I restriction enzyme S subunit